MRLFLLYIFLIPAIPVLAQKSISQKLNDYVDGWEKNNRFNGTVMVVRNDTVLLKRAMGYANFEWKIKNTIDTKFSLASVTKHMTAIAIMQLVEKGKLSPEDKLSRFFPTYPKGDSVTVHMLLTHTSGLKADFVDLYLERSYHTPDSALRYLESLPFEFSPGSKVSYSNIGYYLLSLIIEKASGSDFAAYMQDNIFKPAGMTNTCVMNKDTVLPKKSEMYYKDREGKIWKGIFIDWNLNRGHDGIFSTVEDLNKLDQALSKKTLITSASMEKMNIRYNKDKIKDNFFDTYGYGVMINNPYYNFKRELLSHTGGFAGAVTSFNRFTKDKVFITALSNLDSDAPTLCYGLAGILFNYPLEKETSPQPTTIDSSLFKQFTGRFGIYEFELREGKLFNKLNGAELMPLSRTRFSYKHNPERKFEFLMNKEEKVGSVKAIKGGIGETFEKDSY